MAGELLAGELLAGELLAGELLAGAGKLAGIPGVLIHGGIGLSRPLDTARELARAWPDAELIPTADGGHRWNPGERDVYLAGLDGFARRWPHPGYGWRPAKIKVAVSMSSGCFQVDTAT